MKLCWIIHWVLNDAERVFIVNSPEDESSASPVPVLCTWPVFSGRHLQKFMSLHKHTGTTMFGSIQPTHLGIYDSSWNSQPNSKKTHLSAGSSAMDITLKARSSTLLQSNGLLHIFKGSTSSSLLGEKSDDALVNASYSYKNTEHISQVPKK